MKCRKNAWLAYVSISSRQTEGKHINLLIIMREPKGLSKRQAWVQHNSETVFCDLIRLVGFFIVLRL